MTFLSDQGHLPGMQLHVAYLLFTSLSIQNLNYTSVDVHVVHAGEGRGGSSVQDSQDDFRKIRWVLELFVGQM